MRTFPVTDPRSGRAIGHVDAADTATGKRMGDDGMRRFLRKRALLFQTGPAASIDLLREKQTE